MNEDMVGRQINVVGDNFQEIWSGCEDIFKGLDKDKAFALEIEDSSYVKSSK